MADSPATRPAGIAQTLIVALLVSLVCSALVTAVAITLRPAQARNQLENRQRNILQVVGLLRPGVPIEEQFRVIEPRVVDLATGEYAEDIDPGTFDPAAAALDATTGVVIPTDQDLANIRRRAGHAVVYLVRDGDRVARIILPVYGAGLWSTMYGFLALDTDGNTIRGLKFYQHAETPGLGDQIDKARWLSQWDGKLVYDSDGEPQIEVVRGRVVEGQPATGPPRAGDPVFQVDGLAGATLTGRGVTNLLRYWLGAGGFGPYLKMHWWQTPEEPA